MSSNTTLQNSIIQSWHYLQKVTNIGETDDPNDLYYVLDYLVYAVQQQYPQIPCQAGCSLCCSETGLPRTSALEWRIIHRYIVEVMDEKTKMTVLLQNFQLHGDQIPQFLAEQERIRRPMANLPVPEFGCMYCPFLIAQHCSIYPARPAICRGYGSFTLRRSPPQESQMFACQMASDTLVTSLREQGIGQMALPVWNKFMDKVYELNAAIGTVATLPLWIFSHEEKGDFTLKCNLKPDFQKLRHRTR